MSLLNWGGNGVHKREQKGRYCFYLQRLKKNILLRVLYRKRKEFRLWDVFLFPFAV